MNRLNFKLLFFVFFLLFFSCNRQAEKSEDVHHDTDTVNKDLTPIKITAQNVFVSLPDRKLIFKLIEENKIQRNGRNNISELCFIRTLPRTYKT